MTTDDTFEQQSARILLVDDEPEVLDVVGNLLDQRGFMVTRANSGQRALDHIEAAPYDLVITDCRMSPVDGWAVLNGVKEKDGETPVIMLTGYGDLETAVTALREKADDFLVKPVASESLFARIHICLERQALARRCRAAESTLEMTNRAIEALQVGLVICEVTPPDYPIRYVNKGFETLTGYMLEEVIGRNMSFLRGADTDPAAEAGIRRSLQLQAAHSCDILNYRRGGGAFWNHLTISPVKDGSDTAILFVATLMDVSAQKSAEDERRVSEMRYRRLFERTTDALIIYDRESGRVEDANPAALNLFGHTLTDLKGILVGDLSAAVPAESGASEIPSMDFLDRPVSILARNDDTSFAAEVNEGAFLHGEKEKVIQTIKDITPRLAMETRLRESESRFRQLSESIDDVFWLVDKDMTQTLYISPAYEQMWGHSCADLRQHPDSRLGRIHPDDRFKLMSKIQPSPRKPYEVAYRLVVSKGTEKWIRERGFPVKDASGDIFRLAVVFSDITEEKRLKEEMESHLQQVIHTDRLAAVGEVVAGVAHEINNPNSFITYNTPLLEETWQVFRPIIEDYARHHPKAALSHIPIDELMTDMTEIIDAIKIGSGRINRIVSNLKDFARLDESSNFQPVSVNTVVERAMTIVGAQLRKCADTVEISTEDAIPVIQGHGQKLEQVLVNLLVNAAHAIPDKKGGRITIRTQAMNRLGAVLMAVEDNGAGIAPKDLDRLFEPFFTTRRTEGGTGLGLSVSYGLVKEHGGLIGVLSRPGRGSCFTVYLPLTPEKTLALNPTILCVDDQPAVLKMIRSMLIKTEERYVNTVGNPEAVIPFLETHPEVDVVISDIRMPKIDGWQLLKMIRAQFPLISVILFSGHADVLHDNPDPSARPEAIVSKPFERADLIQAIHSLGRMKL